MVPSEHTIMTSVVVDRRMEVTVHKCMLEPEAVAKTNREAAVVARSSSESDEDQPEEAQPSLYHRLNMQAIDPSLPPLLPSPSI